MIGNGVRLATGVAARLGVGPLLRLMAFAGMCLVAWWIVVPWLSAIPARWMESREFPGFVGTIVGAFVLIAAVVAAFVIADENKWGLWDQVRRAPFLLWCGITDDNETIHLGTLLLWPLIAMADLIVSLCLVLAIMAAGAAWLLSLKVRGSDE